jgi:hypothetical protein
VDKEAGLLVNVVHAESLDTMLSKDLLLSPIHISQTDVDQFLDANHHIVL